MNIIILIFKWKTNKSMQQIPINRGRTWDFGWLILEMDKVDFTVRMSAHFQKIYILAAPQKISAFWKT